MENKTKKYYKVTVNDNYSFLVLAESEKAANILATQYIIKEVPSEFDNSYFALETQEYEFEIPTEENPVVEYEE